MMKPHLILGMMCLAFKVCFSSDPPLSPYTVIKKVSVKRIFFKPFTMEQNHTTSTMEQPQVPGLV